MLVAVVNPDATDGASDGVTAGLSNGESRRLSRADSSNPSGLLLLLFPGPS